MVLALRVAHLRFSYGGGAPLLNDVSFNVASGDVFCLLGPNGSGKTTLLCCVLGLLRTAPGVIQVQGQELTVLTPRQVARALAYVPQGTATDLPYTAFEVVLMGRSPYLRLMAGPRAADRQHALAVMDQLGIASLAARRFSDLSGGERQMVLIARALTQDARMLILDEPTVHLDYGYQMHMLDLIRRLAQQGYGVLMTSHVPDHAFLVGNRVALLKHGRLHGPGPPAEVITDKSLSELYGTTMRVLHVQLPDGLRTDRSLCVPLMDGQEGVHDEIEPRDLRRHADRPAVGDGPRPPGV